MANEEKDQTAEKELQVTMGLIMNAGNAKAFAMEAIKSARIKDFESANKNLKDAQAALVEAHNVQTSMLTREAQGEHAQVNLLMVHAQDHLMTAITFCDLAAEFVEVYKKL
ncbi:PTS lactose/cellobiose transporter subunit IIA [Liquorilactobacillus oeni]|uniref:Uncharacterized protein n=1 Tax=Liquorilactobacillus oeni DSM 19972 TaxID=1423777 RepID=A0A0R1MGV3_9LACO|nr:PTS lactose/cellobiose transporter subunit IIA [Liquorilactobacillus oeni]KRL04565.1 hypothetical protein FD46_GL001696 [Liquorilactobacillus oeni DSM 19972]